jgi:hypothetical protein
MPKSIGSTMTPYEIAAALRRMRDEIDMLLASLPPQEKENDELLGLSMGEAALRVLAQSQRPLRAAQIWKRMIAQGYSSKNGDRSTLGSVSWALALRLKQHGDIEKVARGMWRAHSPSATAKEGEQPK